MDLPRNSFKQALASGNTLYGLWLGLPDTSIAEIAAGAGFDWLLIDHEHGPFHNKAPLTELVVFEGMSGLEEVVPEIKALFESRGVL